MVDKATAKKIYEKALGAKKASLAIAQNLEQNILTLREEFAKQEGEMKDGVPDVSKIKKGLFVQALNFVNKLAQKDAMVEKFDEYEFYRDKLKEGNINKDETRRYINNVALKKETTTTEKDVYDEAKEKLGEEYLGALKELVKMQVSDFQLKLKSDFNKDNGIDKDTVQKTGVDLTTVKELAKILDIKLDI